MDRVGLKNYLLNHADDKDLLSAAHAWDEAGQFGQFDTFSSIDDMATVNGWGPAEALEAARSAGLDAENYRFNGNGKVEGVSNEQLVAEARDEIDNIVDWLPNAGFEYRQEIDPEIIRIVDEADPFEVVNDVSCESRAVNGGFEIKLSRDGDEASIKLFGIDVDMFESIDLATAVYVVVDNYNAFADDTIATVDEIQKKYHERTGMDISAEETTKLVDACVANMDALTKILDDDEIEALDNFLSIQVCDPSYCDVLEAEMKDNDYIKNALNKMGYNQEIQEALEDVTVDLPAKERIVFDENPYYGDDGVDVAVASLSSRDGISEEEVRESYSESEIFNEALGIMNVDYEMEMGQLEDFFDGKKSSDKDHNPNWGNHILVAGTTQHWDGTSSGVAVYENFAQATDCSANRFGLGNVFADCEIDKVWDENGSLYMTGAHHDGRVTVEMRQLTDTGEKAYSANLDGEYIYLPEDGFAAMGKTYRGGDENQFIADLWGNEEMCAKPRYSEKQFGCPAEEYQLDHGNIKTVISISEVNKNSFAYTQDARYEVRTTTDKQDHVNKRLCSNLIEAHSVCGQIVDIAITQEVDHEEKQQGLDALCDAKSAEAELQDYGSKVIGQPILSAEDQQMR